MFADSLVINLIIFALGQATAWGYLRTGRPLRGLLLMVGGWLLGDAALLLRFAFDDTAVAATVCLGAMQAYSLIEAGLFVRGRWRRRRPSRQRERDRRMRTAFECYLRDDLDAARGIYRDLMRRDAWDFDAALGLATVLSRQGKSRSARRWLRIARSLDVDGHWGDVIESERRRLDVRRAAQAGSRDRRQRGRGAA